MHTAYLAYSSTGITDKATALILINKQVQPLLATATDFCLRSSEPRFHTHNLDWTRAPNGVHLEISICQTSSCQSVNIVKALEKKNTNLAIFWQCSYSSETTDLGPTNHTWQNRTCVWPVQWGKEILNRKDAVLLAQIRSGHSNLLHAYRRTTDPTTDPLCSKCIKDKHAVEH